MEGGCSWFCFEIFLMKEHYGKRIIGVILTLGVRFTAFEKVCSWLVQKLRTFWLQATPILVFKSNVENLSGKSYRRHNTQLVLFVLTP